ncbi:MAG TPA: DUF2341 domain-containing protein [Xanthomonadaceae bacterium]|jgi:biopolymer transport protein ExbB
MSRLRLIFAMFLLFACLPASAATWWDGKWHYRARIDVNTTSTGAALQQDGGRTQVLVRLHSGNFDFADAKEDGSDVRFVAGDDRTPLKYHFEKYDGLVDQVALAWVDLPALAANKTTPIYVYFGNPDASAGADAKGSYDAEEVAVLHFANQQAIGQDSTAYGNNATGSLSLAKSALIGSGLSMDGSKPVTVPASASLNFPAAQPLTLSAWIKPASANASGVVLSMPGVLTLLLDNGNVVAEAAGGARTTVVAATSSTSPASTASPATPAATPAAANPAQSAAKDAWMHVAVRADGKTLSVFVNGQPAGEVAASLPAASGGLLIGGETGAARPNFIGQIDEVEVVKAARPVDAIVAAARSQGLDAKLLGFQPVEQASGGGGGYIGILLAALTPDAWVVIIILMIMGSISWFVMIGKGMYINATARANARFLEAFRAFSRTHQLHEPVWESEAKGDGPLGDENSNLARLLDVGLDELRGRLAARPGRTTLRKPSIAAIRSALDAASVREGQRLGKWMVLLTIAISGGPFLGLLGTVVGVMITFAAVAAAGDVNINAIAPGIAAALLATVAGLGVAIPALFGYNYLLSLSEAITADMQVFVDELEKRIAEDYVGDAPRSNGKKLRVVAEG